MAKRYRLKDWDADDERLNDPNAAWRNHSATQRQIQRLKFFQVRHPTELTKGDAADLLDALEPTVDQLKDYDAWKRAGEPNISQWHRRNRPAYVQWAIIFMIIGYAVYRWKFAPTASDSEQKKSGSLTTPSSTPSPKATPRLLPTGPSATAAQQRAVAKFPQLGVKDSALHRAFLERVHRYLTDKPEVFDDADWPTTIATEAAGSVK
jgi:hypothetical protein